MLFQSFRLAPHPLLVAACAGLTSPALSQENGGTDNSGEIVVSAEREVQAKAAAAQARAITQPAPPGKPLARHYLPVCVKVFGLPAAYGQALAERVMDNVRSLNLRVAPAGCSPNVWIGFTNDSRKQVEALRKRDPAMFVSLKQHEIDRIFKGSNAVQVWHATETKGVDGRAIPVARMPDGSEYEVNQQWKASRLGSTIRVDMTGSLVVFDRKLVGRRTLAQLADYATMRVLASTYDQAEFDPAMPTILSLFAAESGAPEELTDFDRAYLGGLYRLGEGADHTKMPDAVRSAYLHQTAEKKD